MTLVRGVGHGRFFKSLAFIPLLYREDDIILDYPTAQVEIPVPAIAACMFLQVRHVLPVIITLLVSLNDDAHDIEASRQIGAA
jgi:hypothetical protein